jgi:hypothetical protein
MSWNGANTCTAHPLHIIIIVPHHPHNHPATVITMANIDTVQSSSSPNMTSTDSNDDSVFNGIWLSFDDMRRVIQSHCEQRGWKVAHRAKDSITSFTPTPLLSSSLSSPSSSSQHSPSTCDTMHNNRTGQRHQCSSPWGFVVIGVSGGPVGHREEHGCSVHPLHGDSRSSG